MALRNVSTDFVTATPSFLPANGDLDQSVKLSPIKLAPSEVVEVNLDPLLEAASNRADLDSVSVQVLNTGNAGSLVGALYSLNTQTGVTYDVPLRDSGPLRASTGAYPVRLDGDYTTVVTISNTTNEPGDFTMQINHDSGHYVTGIIRVAPGGAKTFDIRKLRDEQKPDINGRPLPIDLKIAQVRWSVRGKVRLNGRTEMVSVRDRVSSSYSCFVCCPDSTGGFITPFSATVSPGATFGFTAMEQPYNTGGQSCGGPREPYPIFASSWESDTESVATVDNSGLATAISPGYASISCYWTGFVYVWDDLDESCDVFEEPLEPSAPMTVPPQVTIGSLTAVGKNYTVDVNVTLNPSPSNIPVTLTLSATSGTGTARFSDDTTSKTISQTTMVTIKGVTESSTANNIRLQATAESTTLATVNFTVITVTLALRYGNSLMVSMDNAARSNYQAANGTTNLGLFFSTGQIVNRWRTGVEIVGTVMPSNFTGAITIVRERDYRLYNDQTQIASGTAATDTSSPTYRDDDPQSGESNGKVYDLDGPGVGSNTSDPLNSIFRSRQNFRQWATLSGTGTRVSDVLEWFSRVSIIKTSTGDALRTDVTGDNTAGTGTTNLSWNLQ